MIDDEILVLKVVALEISQEHARKITGRKRERERKRKARARRLSLKKVKMVYGNRGILKES